MRPNGTRGGHRKGTAPKSEKESPKCFTYSCGVSALLDKMCSDTGLDRIVKKSFPDDWDAILTCAYYLVSEGQALSRTEKWSRQAVTPYGEMLADQRISELLVRITPELAQGFFSAWLAHNSSDRYYCMDITSISSCSEANEFVSYGYNRDREKLPQVSLLMVSGHTSHLPLFFRVMPGSIRDVSTMDESLKRLDLVDARRMHMVMDKGFYSEGWFPTVITAMSPGRNSMRTRRRQGGRDTAVTCIFTLTASGRLWMRRDSATGS